MNVMLRLKIGIRESLINNDFHCPFCRSDQTPEQLVISTAKRQKVQEYIHESNRHSLSATIEGRRIVAVRDGREDEHKDMYGFPLNLPTGPRIDHIALEDLPKAPAAELKRHLPSDPPEQRKRPR